MNKKLLLSSLVFIAPLSAIFLTNNTKSNNNDVVLKSESKTLDINEVITNTGNNDNQKGFEIKDNTIASIQKAVIEGNSANKDKLFWHDLEFEQIADQTAVIRVKRGSTRYKEGRVTVNIKPEKLVIPSLKIDIDNLEDQFKDLKVQLDDKKIDSQWVSYSYSSKNIKLLTKQADKEQFFKATLFALDENWKIKGEGIEIKESGLELSPTSNLSAYQGRYLVKMSFKQHDSNSEHTNETYIQVSSEKNVKPLKDFYESRNGQLIIQAAKQNGYKAWEDHEFRNINLQRLNALTLNEFTNWNNYQLPIDLIDFSDIDILKDKRFFKLYSKEEIDEHQKKVVNQIKTKLSKLRSKAKFKDDYTIEFIRDTKISGIKVKIKAKQNSTYFKGETQFIVIQAKDENLSTISKAFIVGVSISVVVLSVAIIAGSTFFIKKRLSKK
ncbi:Hypothetical protein, predicted transmembrane protein [Mycoplasma yeatsii 13926]|uniref:Transmembrane protein n=1 Tax=Mycoplasma yeatsii 13926 TaxID=1188240 RepID=S6G6Q9_9MOLU|nr:hypothetical protein [Mycoplasma yeatsii]EOA06953.1 Hypothetical protein, predicted transmembrane protein [Mycoplasma yeatsii 13926]